MRGGLLVEGLGGVRADVGATWLPTRVLRAALLPTPLLEPGRSATRCRWVVRTGTPDAIQELGWMSARHHIKSAPLWYAHDAVHTVMLSSNLAGTCDTEAHVKTHSKVAYCRVVIWTTAVQCRNVQPCLPLLEPPGADAATHAPQGLRHQSDRTKNCQRAEQRLPSACPALSLYMRVHTVVLASGNSAVAELTVVQQWPRTVLLPAAPAQRPCWVGQHMPFVASPHCLSCMSAATYGMCPPQHSTQQPYWLPSNTCSLQHTACMTVHT